MSITPRNDKYNQDTDSPVSGTSGSGGHTSGHKGSLRGTKLARRARSFKDDFLEKISQMRGPTTAMGRSNSPHSPKPRAVTKSVEEADHGPKNTVRDLELHVRQVQIALKHFRDVITKNKLEMLPGNGTIVLETISAIHSALQCYTLTEQSSVLLSATNQVYQTLARLIQLCDDVLLCGKSALEKENVGEVVELLETAVENLVKLAQEKIIQQSVNNKTVNKISNGSALPKASAIRTSMDLPGQRTSLPDIPLTPRERMILEQTSTNPVRASHSTESVLREPSPPPKPPLPGMNSDMLSTPPPLPPKRKVRSQCTDDSEQLLIAYGPDRVSLRSQSPDDSNSLISGGSLDSVLNHSREEEEIRALMDQSTEDSTITSDLSDLITLQAMNSHPFTVPGSVCWEEPSIIAPPAPGGATVDTHRHSNESGFASMQSIRSSSQSFSKRASQHSSSSFNNNVQQQSANSKTTNTTHLQQTTNNTHVQHQNHKSENIVQNLSTQNSESIMQNLDNVTNIKKTEMSLQKSSFISTSTTLSNLSQVSSMLDGSYVSDASSAHIGDENVPPALPQKNKSRRGRDKRERHPSTYDNLTDDLDGSISSTTEHLTSCALHQSNTTSLALSESSVMLRNSSSSPDENQPPPLPLKKKHIMAYMEMFGNCSHSVQSSGDFLRHSVHAYNVLQAEWQHGDPGSPGGSNTVVQQGTAHSSSISHSHTMSLSPYRHSQPVGTSYNGIPPALPPKRLRSKNSTSTTPPPSPFKTSSDPNYVELSLLSPAHRDSCTTTSPKLHPNSSNYINHQLPTDFEHAQSDNKCEKNISSSPNSKRMDDTSLCLNYAQITLPNDCEQSEDVLKNVSSPLDELDVVENLVIKKTDEDGPDIRGGHPDALVVHATKANKNDFMYQEAFLTTYRTFLSPLELVEKLCHRHKRFSCQPDLCKQRAAKEAFSLLVRVVSDLTISDLNSTLQPLMDFVYQLVCSGHLTMAKPLRVKILEKYALKQQHQTFNNTLSSQNVFMSQATLLDFKSEQIAEQMTMLDADLFLKIEIPEVLVWAQEQCEERSPNLTRFTEHFNKMSYWARSRILDQDDARDREKYVVKFMKIMKHLRKINNFNSYLALLSALDSAPITRLEWPKQTTETLKEYCALIDSRSSFRAYRQALAESQPPCIPYIGLVLQDLTFVHIGNSDLLPDGSINFSKRWQQFNIVDNMKRFKKGTYSYKKNDRIIAYFNNFDNYLNEEAMWQISEGIKPRGGRKTLQ